MKQIAKELLFFNSMLTPRIVTFAYWLMLLAVVAIGIGVMISLQYNFYYGSFEFSFKAVLIGLLVILFGGVLTRIWCELAIVLFRISENAKVIADKLNQSD